MLENFQRAHGQLRLSSTERESDRWGRERSSEAAARIRSPSLAERQANRTAEPQYVRLDLAPLPLLIRQECLTELQSARRGLQKSVGVTQASSEPEQRASSHSCTTRLTNLSLTILFDLWPLFFFLHPPFFFFLNSVFLEKCSDDWQDGSEVQLRY